MKVKDLEITTTLSYSVEKEEIPTNLVQEFIKWNGKPITRNEVESGELSTEMSDWLTKNIPISCSCLACHNLEHVRINFNIS